MTSMGAVGFLVTCSFGLSFHKVDEQGNTPNWTFGSVFKMTWFFWIAYGAVHFASMVLRGALPRAAGIDYGAYSFIVLLAATFIVFFSAMKYLKYRMHWDTGSGLGFFLFWVVAYAAKIFLYKFER